MSKESNASNLHSNLKDHSIAAAKFKPSSNTLEQFYFLFFPIIVAFLYLLFIDPLRFEMFGQNTVKTTVMISQLKLMTVFVKLLFFNYKLCNSKQITNVNFTLQDFPQRSSANSARVQRQRRRRNYYAREDSDEEEEAGLSSMQRDDSGSTL